MIFGEDTGITIGVAVVAIVAIWAMMKWVSGSIKIVETEGRVERQKLADELHHRISKHADDLVRMERRQAEFEIEVAKHYASDDRLKEMEGKFTVAIDKLINRFDAFATDFHKIVGQMDGAARQRASRPTPRAR